MTHLGRRNKSEAIVGRAAQARNIFHKKSLSEDRLLGPQDCLCCAAFLHADDLQSA